jgi:MFS family permease
VTRRAELRLGLALLAAALFGATHIASSFPVVFCFLLVMHIGASIVYHGLYIYTPEVFPTVMRATCFSICQLGQRFAPIASPYVVTHLATTSIELCGSVFVAVFLAANALTCLLHRERFGKALVEATDAPEADEDGDGEATRASTGSHDGLDGDFTDIDLEPIHLPGEQTDLVRPQLGGGKTPVYTAVAQRTDNADRTVLATV